MNFYALEFNVNHPILFVIAGICVGAVLAQSIFFLVRAVKRSKEINMDQNKIKKVIKTAAIFTVAPALAIVISVIALYKKLGAAIPWLRLSVVGSLSYESVAAENALTGMNLSFSTANLQLTSSQFVTVFAVMTVCIMIGMIINPFIIERYQNGMIKLEKKNPKWANILQNSLFIGMISAFIGYVFCDVLLVFGPYGGAAQTTKGLIPVGVFMTAALTMVLCGLAMKKFKWKWLNDYALPISLILGMASAIPLTQWLG